jgi:hypothetical protein
MQRSVALAAALALAFLGFGPSPARAQQYFKADMVMAGGALEAPVSGVMYYNGSKLRMELTVEEMPMVILLEPAGGNLTMLMVEMKMYMQMPPGMIPVTPPSTQTLDADNPCATPGITGCVSLGEQEVNGYEAQGWQYVQDGAQWTSWIAESIDFPVRSIGADGTTTDFLNVSMDPLETSLFEIPSDFQPMQGVPFGG